MKLINLLNATRSFSGELITNSGHETPYSFEWVNDEVDKTSLTPAGVSRFYKVLHSDVTLDGSNIVLLDDSITYEELNDFTAACAGYCAISDHNKWFKEE